MLTPTWLRSATLTLSCPGSIDTRRIAVLGIGNELNTDDAVGVRITQELIRASAMQARLETDQPYLIIAAGLAPENFTGQVRRFKPEVVVLVDAAQMNAFPGTIAWLACQQISGVSGTTHALPLSLLAKYLTDEIGCEVYLLGIQPAGNEFGDELTPRVAAASREVVVGLGDLLFSRV